MKNNIKILVEKFKDFNRFLISQKTTRNVKEFCEKNKNKNNYIKNKWNKNYYWDIYYQCHMNSIKSADFVPYDYFNYKILPNFNNKKYSILVDDKNLYDSVFGKLDVKLPKTMFRYYNGIFLDENYMSIENIDNKIKEIKQNIIVKPSIDSSGGNGVLKYEFFDGKLRDSDKGILYAKDLLDKFSGDFIVQEEIVQHKVINNLYPYSLNTIRVESYRSVNTNEVKILMAALRMGANKSYVDNVSRGGLAVGIIIDEDFNASLREKSYKPFSNEYCTCHPDTGIVFKNVKIPNFEKIVEAIKKLSNLISYLRIISWDFCIDSEGNPVLIELNKAGGIWSTQQLNGTPYFGEYTDEVRKYLKK